MVLAAAVLCTVAAILVAEDLGPDALQGRLLAASSLGIPLFTAVTLAGEQFQSAARRALLAVVSLAVLVAIYLAWPGWSEPVRALRYAQLSVAMHLMVAFLPFIGNDRPNAFWQYNRALFVRFVASATSSGTLYLGLALALLALDKLFGVDVPSQGYFRLWAVVAFVFNTWFFLGGLPKDLDALEERRDYPTGLRIFAQYTLVPLVSLYLVILTLYFGKVVITWDWPSGWIGYLVSGVATAGILALLLVHPVAEQPEQKWIAAFARDFWLGVLPAVFMLWLAAYQRVHQYGITEPRYFLVVLSLWLAAIAVFYAATRSRSIRIIPISLCALALVTYAGPWSAFAVSERSQAGRLERLLVKDGVLEQGHVQRAHRAVSPEDLKEISAIVRYLVDNHGGRGFAAWLGDSTANRLGVGQRGWRGGEGQARGVVEAFGVRYVDRWERPSGAGTPVTIRSADERASIALAGFDYLVPIRVGRGARGAVQAGDTTLAAIVVHESSSIRLVQRGGVLIEIPLDSLMSRALRSAGSRRSAPLPPHMLVAEAENSRARARVQLHELGIQSRSTGAPVLRSASGEVLVRLKR